MKENQSAKRMGICHHLLEFWLAFKLALRSLTYNSFTSVNTLIDVAMEPVIWVVERITKYMGPIMVVMVVFLSSTVVVIMYTVVLPRAMARSTFEACFHIIFGHWLLVNISFHYYKGVTTPPGHPPQIVSETGAGGICKKCIGPKPLRTHHCSVCRTCILKMDHHCPWINNCVGHYNHRYFMLFCLYMWTGTVYVSSSVWPQFREEFFNARKTFESLFGGSLFAQAMDVLNKAKIAVNETMAQKTAAEFQYQLTMAESMYHKAVVYEFFLCLGVVIALGTLTVWHIRLVSKGETSIEKHINDDERKRLKKVNIIYRNPYDFGIKKNWQMLLGIANNKRTFWRHVLLPSAHLPDGDGIHWINQITPGYVAKSMP